ncbi:hypothetical protein [Eleftheria terrae]|uniref:hypothetical protein n=1 Tax=Eleftheria terrae TaxID=1597781 RepID=UPI00263BE34A|nr:hypothetical protein [Eleftheria terrae]WKB50532.1 hypothetical protein N7L95_00350 [Eleftheria terrae]
MARNRVLASLPAAGAVFFGLSSTGAFVVGLIGARGDALAWACLSAGIALSSLMWGRYQPSRQDSLLGRLACASFVLCSGLALYTNFAWALWALGMPMSLGAVEDGKMGEHDWLGPFTLAYAAVCYGIWKGSSKR